MSLANLGLSAYAKNLLENQVAALFFLFTGAFLGVAAWANAKICAELQMLDLPPEDEED
jgi:hypothetical protein